MFTIGSTARTMPGSSRKSPRFRISLLTKFGTCGASCMSRPIPWPTYCSTTVNPVCSVCRCIRLATSDHQRRRPISSIAICSTSSATFTSRSRSDRTTPTGMVTAASAHQPFSRQAVSTLSRSPSRRARGPGMPWTTWSFRDRQVTAGNGVPVEAGSYPLNSGVALWLVYRSSTALVDVRRPDPGFGHLPADAEGPRHQLAGLAHEADLLEGLEFGGFLDVSPEHGLRPAGSVGSSSRRKSHRSSRPPGPP